MDNDAYGHVNNVVYYSWFDTAVNAHLIEPGVLDIHHGHRPGGRDALQLLRPAGLPAAGGGRPARGAPRLVQRALRDRPVRGRRAAHRGARAISSTSTSTAQTRRPVPLPAPLKKPSWRTCSEFVTPHRGGRSRQRRRGHRLAAFPARLPAHAGAAQRIETSCSGRARALRHQHAALEGATCCRARQPRRAGAKGLRRLRRSGAGRRLSRGIRLLPDRMGLALHRPPPRERLGACTACWASPRARRTRCMRSTSATTASSTRRSG
jgi:acyl-CoA thioester hydrolase